MKDVAKQCSVQYIGRLKQLKWCILYEIYLVSDESSADAGWQWINRELSFCISILLADIRE